MNRPVGSIIVAIFLTVSLIASPLTAQSDGELSLMGRQFEVIALAVRELQRRGHAVSGYKITLSKVEKGFIVWFSDPGRPKNIAGNSSNMPEFVVEIGPDLTVRGRGYAQ